MALNNLSFILNTGGTGRQAAGQDYISGLVLYAANGSLPSGFSTSNRIKQLFSIQDAINAGILNDYSDATAAIGSYLITTAGATGDIISIKVAEPLNGSHTLCTYTKLSTDTSIALLGASIAAAINAGTQIHGYSASFTTATLTITAPKKFGVALNTGTPITVTITGTIAGTITQFTGGVGSLLAVWYYHISEYFRFMPNGALYVGIFPIATYTFAEITTMQNFANGTIRRFAVFKDPASPFASADITTIHNVCASLVAAHKECTALYAADISATPDVSTLTDLSTLTANYCTAVIGQDGAAQGAFLFAAYGKSITNVGAALGSLAFARVCESIAWLQKFNQSNGVECDTIAFANGVLFSNSSVSDSLLNTMQNMRYLFLRKFVGVSGSFFNENPASIALSSPYAYIADNATMQKATRGIYASVIPLLNAPIVLNADGTLSDEAIATFLVAAQAPLFQMVRAGEISAHQVTVNGTQSVLQTGVVVINVNIVQIGTGRNINVNIGYQVKVS